MASVEYSVEYEAFSKFQSTMKPLLENVINDVASKLWSRGVLPKEVYDKIFDVSDSGTSWRRRYFMRVFCSKVEEAEKEEPSHKRAKQIIADLVNVLRADSALTFVADALADCNGSSDLITVADDIFTVLDGSLILIAPSIYSKGIISESEYNLIMDPLAKHSSAVTDSVLRAVADAIRINPNHFDTFKRILIEIGPPISELAFKINEARFNLQEKKKKATCI